MTTIGKIFGYGFHTAAIPTGGGGCHTNVVISALALKTVPGPALLAVVNCFPGRGLRGIGLTTLILSGAGGKYKRL